MTQACIPVNLAKDKLSDRHHAALKIIPSLDTGWLSLEHDCVTWPSFPSGWVHFPGGFSDPHAIEPWQTHPRGPPGLPRPCLDPGVKMAWVQARAQLHKQWQLECQVQGQEPWEGRMVTSDQEGQGRHWAGDQSEDQLQAQGHRAPRSTVFYVRKPTVENNIGRRWNKHCLGTVVDFIPKAKRNKLTWIWEVSDEGWIAGWEIGKLLRQLHQ